MEADGLPAVALEENPAGPKVHQKKIKQHVETFQLTCQTASRNSSWWLNQPISKIVVKLDHFPQIKTLETTTYNLYNPPFATSSDTVTSANICFSRVLNKNNLLPHIGHSSRRHSDNNDACNSCVRPPTSWEIQPASYHFSKTQGVLSEQKAWVDTVDGSEILHLGCINPCK